MPKVLKYPEKEITIEDLKRAGVPIVSGREFGLHKLIKKKPKSHEEVRKMLANVKTSFSDEIIRMRTEE